MKTLIAILFSCLTLNAATYYVDYSSGDDSLAGTSTATAWKHAPGDPNGTGVSGSVTLAAGDTVVFKGGVSYSGQVTLLWSGTSGNPITYDGNSSGAWGVGKAIIEGSNVVLYAFPAFTASTGTTDVARNYITIKNFRIQNIGGYAEDDPTLSLDCSSPVELPIGGTGVHFGKGGTGLIIQDCEFFQIGQWRNQTPFSGTGAITGSGVTFVGVRNGTITRSSFSKMRNPIGLKCNTTSGGVLSGITISSNSLGSNFVWGIDIAAQKSSIVFSNITIVSNVFFDGASYDSGNWLGCGEKPHSDIIFLRNSSQTNNTWTNVLITANDFHCDNPGASAGGTAAIYVSEGPSVNIFNNIFRCPPESSGIINVGASTWGPSQEVNIFNNTIIGGSWRPVNIEFNASVIFTRTTRFKNNIVMRSVGDSTAFVNFGTNSYSIVDSDYNLYFKPGFSASTTVFAYDNDNDGSFTDSANFAGGQARGLDAHSIYADPLFVTGTNITTSSLINARLLAGSPAIGSGIDLSAYGVTTDFTGATRSSPPDIGAYQFTATEQGEGGTSATGSAFTSGAVTISGGVILR